MNNDINEITAAMRAEFPEYFKSIAIIIRVTPCGEKSQIRNLHYDIKKDVPAKIRNKIEKFILETGTKAGIPSFTDVASIGYKL
jgi:hypothetical protein